MDIRQILTSISPGSISAGINAQLPKALSLSFIFFSYVFFQPRPSEKKLSTSWFFLPRETKLPYPVRRHSDEQTGEFTDTSFHYSSDEPEIPFHPGLLSVKTTLKIFLLLFFFSILFCV